MWTFSSVYPVFDQNGSKKHTLWDSINLYSLDSARLLRWAMSKASRVMVKKEGGKEWRKKMVNLKRGHKVRNV